MNKDRKEKRKLKKKRSFQLGVKVEISLFLVKTYNVFQHETSDEWMRKNVEKKE